jgi:hypothetical protein
MVSKIKSKATQKKGRIKVGKLHLNKETVKDLGAKQTKTIRGGVGKLSLTGVACICVKL